MNAEFIAEHWPLSHVVIKRILQQSGQRIVFETTSAQGHFVFKATGPSRDDAKVYKDTQILHFLDEAGFVAPRLVLTNELKRYVKFKGGFVYALTYLDGAIPEKNTYTYAELGKVAASLHRVTGYTVSTDFTVQQEIPKMLQRARTFNMDARYTELVSSLPDFDTLPKCLIHTDIGAHNALQQPDGTIVLIDWDDAGIGTRILDIGFPLICDFVTNDLRFEADRAAAFYTAYFSGIELTALEKQYLFDAALFYALNYTIFDSRGIVEGQWQKVLFAVANKDELLAACWTRLD